MRAIVRWMIRRDIDAVMKIEQSRFDHPWTEAELMSSLKQIHVIGLVAEYEGEIVGFIVYELLKEKLMIVNLAVSLDVSRQGVGSQLVSRLIDKLSRQDRKEILLEVRETNLLAQLFFKSQGFCAIKILREDCEDARDAYLMCYKAGAVNDPSSAYCPCNRISEYA